MSNDVASILFNHLKELLLYYPMARVWCSYLFLGQRILSIWHSFTFLNHTQMNTPSTCPLWKRLFFI